MNTPQPEIFEIEVFWEKEPSANLDYLNTTYQDYFGDGGCKWDQMSQEDRDILLQENSTVVGACQYLADLDYQRKLAYRRGEWHMEKCVIRARVFYLLNGNKRLQRFSSKGHTNIESDEDDDLHAQIEYEQLTELKAHLEVFGVNTDRFWELTGVPEPETNQEMVVIGAHDEEN